MKLKLPALLVLALPAAWAWSAELAGPRLRSARRAAAVPSSRSTPLVCKEEFTRREEMLVESQAPFRQARLLFFYPATIAGASIAGYVSFTRLLAGLGGFRTDTVPVSDGINLFVNIGVVVAAVLALRNDLKGRTADLERVSGKSKRPKDTESEE